MLAFLGMVLFLGPKAFSALIFVMGVLCVYEYYSVIKKPISVRILYMAFMLMLLLVSSKNPQHFLLPALFVIALLIFTYNLFIAKKYDIGVSILDIWGFTFIGLGMTLVLNIANTSSSWLAILAYIIAVGVLNDTMAYFIGVRYGKHKLCPVSPKKSKEGAIAGVLASVAVSIIFALTVFKGIPLIHFILLGVLAGFGGELGDLSASMVKRKFGAKDFGNLMPGHGGALDRIDNLLFTVPIIYYYFDIFLGLL